MLVPKFRLIFLKVLNFSCLICLANNIKASHYLDKIPVNFHFICLPLFYNIVLVPHFSFTYIFHLYSCLPQPLVHRHAFFPLLFVVVLFTYFIWRWFDAFCYFSFSAYEASSIKNWFLLATGLAENCTHMVFHQPFVVQCVRTWLLTWGNWSFWCFYVLITMKLIFDPWCCCFSSCCIRITLWFESQKCMK